MPEEVHSCWPLAVLFGTLDSRWLFSSHLGSSQIEQRHVTLHSGRLPAVSNPYTAVLQLEAAVLAFVACLASGEGDEPAAAALLAWSRATYSARFIFTAPSGQA